MIFEAGADAMLELLVKEAQDYKGTADNLRGRRKRHAGFTIKGSAGLQGNRTPLYET